MHLERCKKRFINSTHRVKTPEETFDAIKDKMPRIGITKEEEITSLDRVGIPVFLSFRKEVNIGAVSIYKGKGSTLIESRVSAMMEAVERYSSELAESLITVAPASLLKSPFISPQALILPNPFMYNENMTIGWSLAYNLMEQSEIFVPSNAVFHPYPQNLGWFFRSNTNGLASGNCIEEAVLHALCEVIERDAWSLAEVSRSTPPSLDVDVEDDHINTLLDKFNDAKVSIQIKDITSDLGVPTFLAVSDDQVTKDPTLLNIGVGTHLSPRVALLRALTEVAQSRLSQIYENINNPQKAIFKKRLGYDKIKNINKKWYSRSESVKLSEIEPIDTPYIRDDIEVLLKRLSDKNFEQTCVVDLTREEIGISVVRVIVPGLEQCSVDRDRIGKRAKNIA